MKILDKRLLGQLSSELSSHISNMLDLEAGLLKQPEAIHEAHRRSARILSTILRYVSMISVHYNPSLPFSVSPLLVAHLRLLHWPGTKRLRYPCSESFLRPI
jgi:hypothetical protein